jgi:hypothetical protein
MVLYSGDGEWRVAQGGGLNTEEQHYLIEKKPVPELEQGNAE